MSRIGRLPVSIPAGVTVTVADDNTVTVKGPKGTLTQQFNKDISLQQEGAVIHVTRPSDDKFHRSLHGLTRTLLNNMVQGVTNGFTKSLEIQGVGYRAAKQGKKLVLTVGYSHPVEFEEPAGITIDVPTQNKITLTGIDKQAVGQLAAEPRSSGASQPCSQKDFRLC
ncbi:MAG: 50S ribosomal protein L6 [Clostridiales bacterium]|nr:50S ribosomal protein L6 [Clostridiales bacterium]